MRALLCALLASSAIFAQSLDELKRKYGSPISETFAVRTDIGIRVRRAPDGAVTEMIIVPIRTDSLVESRRVSFSYEAAKNVLDELVPSSRRGKFLIGGFVNALCMPENDCAGSSEDYEKVHIYYNSAAKAGQVCYVSVRFKR